MWQGWFNLTVAAWLIFSTFISAIRTPASMIVASIVAVVFGFWSAAEKSWQGTINGIIGVWLFLSGIWFGLAAPWNFFISGIVIGVIAIWNITDNHEHHAAHAM